MAAMARRPAPSAPHRPGIPWSLLADAPAGLVAEDRWVAVRAGPDTRVAREATDVELRESVLSGVDLAGRDLRRLHARDVRFERCDLSGTVLDSAALHAVEFVGCRMTGVMLGNATLRDVRLVECRADLANWRMSSATRLLARSTSLREADFYDVRLSMAAFYDCDLRSAAFRDCRFADVDLHGSRLDDLREVRDLAGVSLAGDQVLPVALALLAAQHIAVTDRPRWDDHDTADQEGPEP